MAVEKSDEKLEGTNPYQDVEVLMTDSVGCIAQVKAADMVSLTAANVVSR